MSTFEDLYNRLVRATRDGNVKNEIEKLKKEGHSDHQLDCLLFPKKYAPVVKWEKCNCGNKKNHKCMSGCMFDAIKIEKDGNVIIDKDKCVGCSECVKRCPKNKFKINKEVIPVIEALKTAKGPVYALIAPAFIGQFNKEVTPGRLRGAFKRLGFSGMIEVALFADILTLREALEFDRRVKTEKDFQLTSCCCPMWIAMIRKVYSQLMPNVPAAVSPMIACGRSVKKLHPNAVTVFIGPCLAKRAEARESDICDAIDHVLTFQEINDLFQVMGINPEKCKEIDKDHSSRAGRIYAKAGGVSEAVSKTFERIRKYSSIELKARRADGVPECKKMLNELIEGKATENFFEGMGCKGGCVGGPRAIIDKEQGTKNVCAYGDIAKYPTPIDNPYVVELLRRLGFPSIESLLKDDILFTRKFK